jgi:hypothetical protein
MRGGGTIVAMLISVEVDCALLAALFSQIKKYKGKK